MKILRNISILAAAAGLFCGCQELEMVRTYAPEDVVAPALRSIMQGETAVEEITVTSENMGETVTFTWDAADFGVKTQINYAVDHSCSHRTHKHFRPDDLRGSERPSRPCG